MVAILCRKEQELKPDGLFVEQTYLQRFFQTSMENNIANNNITNNEIHTRTDHDTQRNSANEDCRCL